ncbi:MAG: ABC transporter permease [Candidatus Poribacteria bacterium]|nr:ABC transporter permease [Candidatus Poribacteria bacterium]MDE0505088.1 ABC transporter permease [Candidatus Poribacteria bacterium]
MKNIISICGKELYTYFVSPIAYFVFFVFMAVVGFLFTAIFFFQSGSDGSSAVVMQVVFGNISIILLFFTPALTMKLFAEERKSGTIELLLTSPVTDTEVVIGKFLASLSMLLTMLFLTLLFPLLVLSFGDLDAGPIFSGYLGLVLLGSCFLSLGLMLSSMSKNQVVAALTSFGLLLTLWVIGFMSDRGGKLGEILAYLSLTEHFEDFARGVVSLNHAVYYLSFTTVCLFATVKSIESSKWR